MDFSLYKDNFSRFGLAKGSYSLAYAGTNKLFFFKVLQGMTITMEDLDPKFLDIDDETREALDQIYEEAGARALKDC